VGAPCSMCRAGGCVVCKGILPPGPTSFDDIPRFKREVEENQHFQVSQLFAQLRELCISGDWHALVHEFPLHSGVGLSEQLLFALQESDDMQQTLLHLTLLKPTHSHCARRIAQKLIEHGSDVRATDSMNITPIYLCLRAYLTLVGQSRATFMKDEVEQQGNLLKLMLSKVPQDEVSR
jgi:hypothetical protein